MMYALACGAGLALGVWLGGYAIPFLVRRL
jgi:hypothetical protein